MDKPAKIAPAKGKLGVLLPGMGAVGTTFMAGVELVRKKKAVPVGSLIAAFGVDPNVGQAIKLASKTRLGFTVIPFLVPQPAQLASVSWTHES